MPTKSVRLADFRLAIVATAVLALLVGPSPSEAKTGRRGKLDKHLAETIARQGDADSQPVKVIVTTRPGSRTDRRNKLVGRGATVSDDFTVIDASAARIPLNRLRALENDPDVVSISVDAPVHGDGIASTVTGTALSSPYTLRSTLGLESTSQVTIAATTNAAVSSASSLAVAHTTGTAANRLMLVAVTLFGDSSRQVNAVTYAGQSLSLVHARRDNASQVRVEIWRLVNPPSGAANAVVTLNDLSDGFVVGVTTLTGVHQQAPLGTPSSNQGVNAAPSVGVASITGERVFGAVAIKDAVSLTPAASEVQLWSAKNGTNKLRGAVSTAAGGSSPTLSWQAGTIKEWAMVAVPVRPASVATTSLTGAGVTVAVVDSGLVQDGGATARIKTTRDFTSGAATPPERAALDPYGHGTHVAGLIGGDKAEAKGVAPGVSFVSLRALDAQGVGYTSHVINAIQWAVANKAAYGIDVLNISLGHPIFEPAASDPLVQAVEAASRAGITVVVAAGNMGRNPQTGLIGYTGIGSPANAPSAITVGSSRTLNTTTRQDDVVSDFSSRGPTWYDAFQKPDLVAPGQYLLGPAVSTQTLYANVPALRGPSYGGRAYMHMSGTSMAASVVSGSVALMIEKSRQQFGARPTTHALKAMLQRSAVPLSDASGTRYDLLTQGAGSLNTLGAIDLAGALNPTASIGWNWVSATIPLTSTIDGQVIGWNDNVVWGTTVLWGDTLNTRLNAWSDNVVWGTTDNVVWGTSLSSYTAQDNVVWGTSTTWLDNVVWGTSDNVVWGTNADNVVWGTLDNVVWGTTDENVVWGTSIPAVKP